MFFLSFKHKKGNNIMHQTSKKCRLIPVNQIEKPQPTEIWNRVPKPERPSPPTLSSDTVETLMIKTTFPPLQNILTIDDLVIENHTLEKWFSEIKKLNPKNPKVIHDINNMEQYLLTCKEQEYFNSMIDYWVK